MDSPGITRLPPRQHQIALLVSQGRTNKEIALLLGVSVHTVRNTLLSIFDKLGVRNRVGVARAVALGLTLPLE